MLDISRFFRFLSFSCRVFFLKEQDQVALYTNLFFSVVGLVEWRIWLWTMDWYFSCFGVFCCSSVISAMEEEIRTLWEWIFKGCLVLTSHLSSTCLKQSHFFSLPVLEDVKETRRTWTTTTIFLKSSPWVQWG